MPSVRQHEAGLLAFRPWRIRRSSVSFVRAAGSLPVSELPPEEGWEADVGSLLGALPEVEPPEGFIAAALDHRPLGALRTLVALGVAVLVAVAASLAVGSGGGIIPALDDLNARHAAASSRLGATGGEADPGPSVGGATAGPTESLESHGYEQAELIDADDLRQAVFARDGEVVSVFELDGEQLAWSELPAGDRTVVGENEAWVDEERAMTIVETGDGIVAIVGLAPGDVAAIIDDLPASEPSLGDRAEALAASLAGQLGFPG